MQTIAPEQRLQVAVGILVNAEGKMLVQRRLTGKPCAGQWEFPGGKIENEETAEQGLIRELEEELQVRVSECEHLIDLPFDYSHANVMLRTYLVQDFLGDPVGAEGQVFAWKTLGEIRSMDVLEAVFPILEAIQALTDNNEQFAAS